MNWLFKAPKKRIEKDGTDRRTSEASQSGSAGKSDSGTGGTEAQGAAQGAYYTYYSISNTITGQGTSIGQDFPDPVWGYYIRAHRMRNGKWAPPWMGGELGKPNKAVTWARHNLNGMRSEGVQAGEIMAWRCWHWNGKRLRSVFVDYEWPLKSPAKGQPGRGYGIHAFKSYRRALTEYGECVLSGDLLVGRVALWGDVVEFEAGYTAEFAKVVELEKAPEEVLTLYGLKKNGTG